MFCAALNLAVSLIGMLGRLSFYCIMLHLQPASSSDSEGNNDRGGSDEEEDDEEVAVPQKADSGSEVDSESGSEDQGREAGGGAVKRKQTAPRVGVLISSFLHNQLVIIKPQIMHTEVQRTISTICAEKFSSYFRSRSRIIFSNYVFVFLFIALPFLETSTSKKGSWVVQ